MAQAVIGRLPEDEHRIQLRRAVVASTIGTAIEWYDFFLYSTVTGLVFAKLFFPIPTPGGDARSLRRLRRRLYRASDRRGDLRPLRRPYRSQGNADCNLDADGDCDLPGRLRSHL